MSYRLEIAAAVLLAGAIAVAIRAANGKPREPELDFRPRPEVTIKGYVLDLQEEGSRGGPAMSRKQSAAARQNIKKAARKARSKRTIARLPKRSSSALGEKGGKAARRKRKTR